MTKLDPRRNAYRPDLADARLKGLVEAERFAAARPMQVIEPLIGVHKAPRYEAMQLTQALMGETLKVFAENEGWAWAQLERDGYVGYVNANALSANVLVPTHRVAVPSTFLYPAPNLKSQPALLLTMNAQVTVTGGDEKFARLANGRFVFTRHLKPVDTYETDFVAVAAMFQHVPYYWGGKSVQGLDCSGLVQLALEAAGIAALRDSDMQEETLGARLMINDLDGLARGDLVFWNGHAGIMMDATTLLHANGFHMMAVAEPLQDAVARIAMSYGQVTSVRRF